MVLPDEALTGASSRHGTALPDGEHERVAVLEWGGWKGFLLSHVLGDEVLRIPTDPFLEFPEEQFDRVCNTSTTVCFQINLSVRDRLPLRISELTERFEERGIYVVNGRIQDIRKSTLQKHLLALGLHSPRADRSGPSDEMLFVKTDLNFGGDLERDLPRANIVSAGIEHLISPDIGAYHYKAVERGKLDEQVWTDPTVVVEKYITNSENSFYRAYFSGKQIIIVHAFNASIIKKIADDARDTNFVSELDFLSAGTDGLPISAALKRDIATFVENTPMEFGCIDIVHDGQDKHYIVDLNLTPYSGSDSDDAELHDFLRLGIIAPTQRRMHRCSMDSPLVRSS